MGVLGTIDGNALALYCQTWSRWRKAEEFIAQHGDSYIVKDRKGNFVGVRLYPQVKLANQLGQQVAQLGRDFGLSPSARARIRAIPPAAYALKNANSPEEIEAAVGGTLARFKRKTKPVLG